MENLYKVIVICNKNGKRIPSKFLLIALLMLFECFDYDLNVFLKFWDRCEIIKKLFSRFQ